MSAFINKTDMSAALCTDIFTKKGDFKISCLRFQSNRTKYKNEYIFNEGI